MPLILPFGKENAMELGPTIRVITVIGCALAAVLATFGGPAMTAQAADATPVTVDNFIHAESDLYFGSMVKDGSLGKFLHRREPASIDGFWSVSLYNAEGYYEKNQLNVYSVNSVTAKKGEDGSTAIQFGGCDGKIANCLPIMKGWNYTVRLYRPRPEILDGNWAFPQPKPKL